MIPNRSEPGPIHIIVSGLPRSGTSMMMQMLQAGGMPLFTDGQREADASNPRGYFETEAVKHTQEDHSWLEAVDNRPVKMVYRLLYTLPLDRQYRVVFMRRDMQEVMASQCIMLKRLGQWKDAHDNVGMERLFREELATVDAWLAANPCFRTIYVDYGECIAAPVTQSRRINRFLEGGLCPAAMALAADPSLYRCRSLR